MTAATARATSSALSVRTPESTRLGRLAPISRASAPRTSASMPLAWEACAIETLPPRPMAPSTAWAIRCSVPGLQAIHWSALRPVSERRGPM
ncbi:MAG: hypothetical protein B7Z72_12830 [Gemmatimonadetes bacterium 21-71-4]|nr:MAG: hypothetical protein B7Z72_12830 [Gemmatimonadetes bacterium 21-71-4]